MAKVEDSIWRCTVAIPTSQTGVCDATMIQQEMESHLDSAHRIVHHRPLDVVAHFVLVRTAEVPRGPGRRPVVKDTTEPMFAPGKDFR